MTSRVALGSDHAGRALRLHLAAHLRQGGFAVVDLGCHAADAVDYPHYAVLTGQCIRAGEADFGILVCGTGIGMSMAANRLHGIRGALCTDPYMANVARGHNDANILCLGARVIGFGLAVAIVDAFMIAPFAAGHHAARVAQLTALEKTL